MTAHVARLLVLVVVLGLAATTIPPVAGPASACIQVYPYSELCGGHIKQFACAVARDLGVDPDACG